MLSTLTPYLEPPFPLFLEPAPRPAPEQPRCSTCALARGCMAHGLDEAGRAMLDGLMGERVKVGVGGSVFHEGDTFRWVYAVRTGTVKTAMTRASGGEQVCGLNLPGDIIGLDGVADGVHQATATALEDAEVCRIPFARLTRVAAGRRALHGLAEAAMARALRRQQQMLVLLGRSDAPERVAGFLLDLSQRLEERGYSPREFHLRMSRSAIGSLLGLSLETISRMLMHLQREGLISVQGRLVRINDLDAMRRRYGVRLQR